MSSTFGPRAEKFRAEILQPSRQFAGHIRRGDEKIRAAGFLSRLPEANLRKFPQIPRQRPRIGGDDGDARIWNFILPRQFLQPRRQPQQILAGVRVGVGIFFIRRN